MRRSGSLNLITSRHKNHASFNRVRRPTGVTLWSPVPEDLLRCWCVSKTWTMIPSAPRAVQIEQPLKYPQRYTLILGHSDGLVCIRNNDPRIWRWAINMDSGMIQLTMTIKLSKLQSFLIRLWVLKSLSIAYNPTRGKWFKACLAMVIKCMEFKSCFSTVLSVGRQKLPLYLLRRVKFQTVMLPLNLVAKETRRWSKSGRSQAFELILIFLRPGLFVYVMNVFLSLGLGYHYRTHILQLCAKHESYYLHPAMLRWGDIMAYVVSTCLQCGQGKE